MSDVITWRAEYNPLSIVGAVRFFADTFLALAIIFRGACHSIGVLQYHRDRLEWAQEEIDSQYRLWRFSVDEPAIPPADEFRIRLTTAWLGTVIALSLAEMVTVVGGHAPLATLIAAANWGLLAADPLLFAAEHRNLW